MDCFSTKGVILSQEHQTKQQIVKRLMTIKIQFSRQRAVEWDYMLLLLFTLAVENICIDIGRHAGTLFVKVALSSDPNLLTFFSLINSCTAITARWIRQSRCGRNSSLQHLVQFCKGWSSCSATTGSTGLYVTCDCSFLLITHAPAATAPTTITTTNGMTTAR